MVLIVVFVTLLALKTVRCADGLKLVNFQLATQPERNQGVVMTDEPLDRFFYKHDRAKHFAKIAGELSALRFIHYGLGIMALAGIWISTYVQTLSATSIFILGAPFLMVLVMRLFLRAALEFRARQLSRTFDADLNALAERVRSRRVDVSLKKQRKIEFSILRKALTPPYTAPSAYTILNERNDQFDAAEHREPSH